MKKKKQSMDDFVEEETEPIHDALEEMSDDKLLETVNSYIEWYDLENSFEEEELVLLRDDFQACITIWLSVEVMSTHSTQWMLLHITQRMC